MLETIKKWFGEGETGSFRKGDTLLMFEGNEEYRLWIADGDGRTDSDTSIVKRAPIPAWGSAPAILATIDGPRTSQRALVRSEDSKNVWYGENGWVHSDDLRDVLPLIPAKVTDAMIVRAYAAWDADESDDAYEVLVKALEAAIEIL